MKHIAVAFTLIFLFSLVGCVSTAQVIPTATPEPSATPVPTDTPTLEPMITPTPTETLTPTSTPDLAATADQATRVAAYATQYAMQTAIGLITQQAEQAENDLWNKMEADGAVSLQKGKLYAPSDYDQSWAQRDWYRWKPFFYDMADFVIMTHIAWDSAAPIGQALDGGCGFVFRLQGKSEHLVVYLTIDKRARLGAATLYDWQFIYPGWENPKLKKSTDQQGEADFMLAVEKEKVTAYIDGERAYKWYVARITSGDIGYTVLSGTNKDYGTSCQITNTRIWKLIK